MPFQFNAAQLRSNFFSQHSGVIAALGDDAGF
jgi:hypothetical protein